MENSRSKTRAERKARPEFGSCGWLLLRVGTASVAETCWDARQLADRIRSSARSGGELLVASVVARPLEDGRRKYVCERLPGRPNCGRMTSLADGLEEEVVAQVFAALDTPTLRFLSADAKGDDAQARTLARELQTLEARVEALST